MRFLSPESLAAEKDARERPVTAVPARFVKELEKALKQLEGEAQCH